MIARAGLLACALALALACSTREEEAAREAAASGVRMSAIVRATCGAKSSECPMQSWMKSNASPPLVSADFERLERAFDRIGALEPSGASYTRWRDVSRAGARSARDHDLDGARLACKRCHDEYRDRYRAERRSAPLP